MTIPAGQDPLVPFPGFNFHVQFALKLFENIKDGKFKDSAGKEHTTDKAIITGGFSEVSGLEATMEPKTIRAGGDNYRVHQRAGSVSFATVVLKRGLVSSRHLWGWWSLFAGANDAPNGGWAEENRSDVSIFLIKPAISGTTNAESSRSPSVGWALRRAMPVKFRVGDLNAGGDEIAIEELHLVHEGLHMEEIK